MAFDEAMFPSRSTFNRMRVYIKDKPHKWGTKLFMLCCSTTAYCIRFEVYCGKKERAGQTASTDHKSGPAAVARNLQQVFGPTAPLNGEMRLVVMDRFYSSVPLSMLLLTMGFYSIGTVRTDRLGLSTKLIPKKKPGEKKKPPKIPKNRPASIERGTFIVAEALHVPAMRVLRWWDTRAVHMLSTGGSVQPDRIVRRETLTGEQQEVACPRVVKDYQTYMGASMCTTSYDFKVNAFIVFNAARAAAGLPKLSHVKFLKQLHIELCQLEEDDWEALCSNVSFQATPSKEPNAHRIRRANHQPLLNDEWRPGNNNQGRKRRTRTCKVCSLLKDTSNAPVGASSTYCSTCKLQTSSKKPMVQRVFLCDKKRHAMKGELRSCFDIWHVCWSNGTLAPAPKRGGKRAIRARAPAHRQVEGEEERSGEEASDESTTTRRPPKQARRAPRTMATD
ncbi:hypothetical protein PR002_g6708 [Phytophthora rubi]|nr:hypothetical protein PR002_g6708 [Phytophthora rubi]